MAIRSVAVETPAPEPRSRHTVHMVGNLLHVFGGYDGNKPTEGNVFTLNCDDPAGMEGVGEGGDEGKDKKEKKEDEGGDEDA